MTGARNSTKDLTIKLAQGALDGTWTLDAGRTTVAVKTKSMWGLMKINAHFTAVEGEAAVVDGNATARVALAANSIDTKNAKRDKHLRSADFLNSEEFADITFMMHSVSLVDELFKASGTLTVRDTTRPVSFQPEVSTLDSGEIAIEVHLEVDRSDYGLSWNQMGMASMSNEITIHAVFTRG